MRLLGWLFGDIDGRPPFEDHMLGRYTDAERAVLMRRGADACSVPEHARSVELHGYWKHQAGELQQLLDDAHRENARLRRLLDRSDRDGRMAA